MISEESSQQIPLCCKQMHGDAEKIQLQGVERRT